MIGRSDPVPSPSRSDAEALARWIETGEHVEIRDPSGKRLKPAGISFGQVEALLQRLRLAGYGDEDLLVAIGDASIIDPREVAEEIQGEGWNHLAGADLAIEVWIRDDALHAFFTGDELLAVAEV